MLSLKIDCDLHNADWPKRTNDIFARDVDDELPIEDESELNKKFDSAKHPRGDNGRFVDSGQIKAAAKNPSMAAYLMSGVTDSVERSRLVDAFKSAGMKPETFDSAVSILVNPKNDYQENGVKSVRFKQWFGDWENDKKNASKVLDENGQPAKSTSQVVDEKGNPVVMYHGTPNGGFTAFDPRKLTDADGLLYGPGFYFTQDQSIASEYAMHGLAHNVRKQMNDAEFDQYSTAIGETLPSGWKMIQHPRMEGLGQFLEVENASGESAVVAREDNDMPGRWIVELEMADMLEFHGLFDTADKLRSMLPRAEVKKVYLNIRKPFDPETMRLPVNDELEKKLMQRGTRLDADTFEREMIREAITKRKVSYELLVDVLRGKQAARNYIESLGFDGMKHIGGGNVGDREHQVWIAFRPNQIKAVDNEGTFDDSNSDIFKRYTAQSGDVSSLTKSHEFREEEHPRADNGRWIKAEFISEAAKDRQMADDLRAITTKPEQRKLLDKAIDRAGDSGPWVKPSELPESLALEPAWSIEGTKKRDQEEIDSEVRNEVIRLIEDTPESGAQVEIEDHRVSKFLENMGWEEQDLASLCGAPDDAIVVASLSDSSTIYLSVQHDDIEKCYRFIKTADGSKLSRADDPSNLIMENDAFFARESGGGLGSQVFTSQVVNAHRKGIKYIKTVAGRGPGYGGSKPMVGYIVWPRLGYDCKLVSDHISQRVCDDMKKDSILQHAKTIQDVMDTQYGQEWWAKNGVGIADCVFSLDDRSRSFKRLASYHLAKKRRSEGVNKWTTA